MFEVPGLLDICQENHGGEQGPGKGICIPGAGGGSARPLVTPHTSDI